MRTLSVAEHLPSLRALLPEAEFLGADDIRPLRCTSDSRRVRPGDLFAALPGRRCDGHDFIDEAVGRGAAAVLCERPPEGISVPCGVVPHVHHAYGRLCQALAGNPSRQLKLIGVTGTNGKTTTSCLIASVLLTGGYRVGVAGTLGYFDGQEIEQGTHTTPPADVLAPLLARMVTNECSHAAMEVSSHALTQCRLAGVTLDVACVTNVSRDHLNYHGTLGDYRLAKSKIFDYLAPEGFAVVNADDPVAAGYLRHFHGPALTIGINKPAEITAAPVEQFASEQTFLLTAGNDTVPVRTRMIGTHHIYNCLTAAAVGLTYGIDLMAVVRGLEAVDYVPGRLQRIECGQPFTVFVDYAHTPDALAASLRALRQVTAGRLICVFGAGGDLRPSEASADGPRGRETGRPRRAHQRQSAERRPAGNHRPGPRGIPSAAGGEGDRRSHGGRALGAGPCRAGRLCVDRRKRAREISDHRRRAARTGRSRDRRNMAV